MSNKVINEDQLNPAIVELVRMGEGLGSTIISGKTPEETKSNLRKAFQAAKERMRSDSGENDGI